MSYSSKVVSGQLDYGFLLLTHIVCADGQIHSEELKYLRELGDRVNISQSTKDKREYTVILKIVSLRKFA